MTFTYNGTVLDYADYAYNCTRLNERAVEIPIAREFIHAHGVDLEIGNVLRHYGHTGHRVVDRYEADPHVENVDVFDIEPPSKLSVVAISTLEHVRQDETVKDPDGAVRALDFLRSYANSLFVTAPMGHNPKLDDYLLEGNHGATTFSTLIRDGDGWVQTDKPVWKPYGATTIWAESIWIGEWV